LNRIFKKSPKALRYHSSQCHKKAGGGYATAGFWLDYSENSGQLPMKSE
jgi:hypothetical protein